VLLVHVVATEGDNLLCDCVCSSGRFGVGPGTGAQRVVIDRVLVFGDGGAPIPNTTLTGVPGGSAIDLGPVSDTSTVRDTVLWFFGIGTGIKIGRGSEV
jgi:hypothetical protein